MPKAKHEQMDFSGLEIVADEFTGTFNGEITVDAGDVTGLAEVATSGDYGDLDNTPAIPTVDFATISALEGDWRGEGSETLVAALTALQGLASA